LQEAGPMVFLGGKTGAVQGGTKKAFDKKNDNPKEGLTFEKVAQEVLSDKEKEVAASKDSTFSRRKEVPKDSAETDEDDSTTDGSEVKRGNISIPVYKFVFDNSQPLDKSIEETGGEAVSVSVDNLKVQDVDVQQEGVVKGEKKTTQKAAKAQNTINLAEISKQISTGETRVSALKNIRETLRNAETDVGENEQTSESQSIGDEVNAEENGLRLRDKGSAIKNILKKADKNPSDNRKSVEKEPTLEVKKEPNTPVSNENTKRTESKLDLKEAVRPRKKKTPSKLVNKSAEEAPRVYTERENTTTKINVQEASKYVDVVKNVKKPLKHDVDIKKIKKNEVMNKDGKAESYKANEAIQKVGKTKLSSEKHTQNFTVNRDALLQRSDGKAPPKALDESFSKALENSVLRQTNNKIFSMVKNREMQADFQLDPPALGKLNLHIVTKGENIYTVINAESDTAKQILNKNQHILRDSLESSGFQLEKFSVNVGGENGQRFNEQPETRKNSKNRKYSTASLTSVESFVPNYNIASSGRLDISA